MTVSYGDGVNDDGVNYGGVNDDDGIGTCIGRVDKIGTHSKDILLHLNVVVSHRLIVLLHLLALVDQHLLTLISVGRTYFQWTDLGVWVHFVELGEDVHLEVDHGGGLADQELPLLTHHRFHSDSHENRDDSTGFEKYT